MPTAKTPTFDSDRTRRLIEVIAPALRTLLGQDQRPKVVSFDDSDSPAALKSPHSVPLGFQLPAQDSTEAVVKALAEQITAHSLDQDSAPELILVKGLGLFRASEPRAVSQHPAGRVAGKIVVVTGAARGLGLDIARDLAAQGAHLALTDINFQAVQTQAGKICDQFGPGTSLGLAMDVTSSQSIDRAIHKIVRTFGGFDLFISNAGVLKAGSVKTLPEADFDLVTNVNYKGYFLCVRKVAPILAVQHLARPCYTSDIIQINSKSGLVGSNRNSAYAGSKFGGIGLTQSFALELIADGIKVNAICPGNFFDGPLWSDPQDGLFVQYLRSGKVPQARTVEDVRRAYQGRIPLGRGCTTADLTGLIYYIVEQQYETGQAYPVTGGEVMRG